MALSRKAVRRLAEQIYVQRIGDGDYVKGQEVLVAREALYAATVFEDEARAFDQAIDLEEKQFSARLKAHARTRGAA